MALDDEVDEHDEDDDDDDACGYVSPYFRIFLNEPPWLYNVRSL
jgi:hypothetical protein